MDTEYFKPFAADVYQLNYLFDSYMNNISGMSEAEQEAERTKMFVILNGLVMRIGQIKSELKVNSLTNAPAFPEYEAEIRELVRLVRVHSKHVIGKVGKTFGPEESVSTLKTFWTNYLAKCDRITKDLFGELFFTDSNSIIKKEVTSEPISNLEEADNLYTVNKISEKLLYLKYSGIWDNIKESLKTKDGKFVQAKMNRVLGHFLDEKPKHIAIYIKALESFDQSQKVNTPYTIPAVKNTIKALDEVGLDSKDLFEILQKLES